MVDSSFFAGQRASAVGVSDLFEFIKAYVPVHFVKGKMWNYAPCQCERFPFMFEIM